MYQLLQKLEDRVQKMEEKIMMLLTQIEDSQNEIGRLNHENSLMIIEREKYADKISKLISMLDAAENIMTNVATTPMKPVLVQG